MLPVPVLAGRLPLPAAAGGDVVTGGGCPESGTLRAELEKATADGYTMADLTVLDKKNDPFRLDTPAHHRDGEWLATLLAELVPDGREIHLRGLHYVILGRVKPDGTSYRNDEKNWDWLNTAAKAARWLGYVPFDRIIDQRNDPPVIRPFSQPRPYGYLSTGIYVDIPDDISPDLDTDDFRGVQPYKIVMIGEKSSLDPVLSPVARDHEADLYLPTGEISITQMHRMAANAVADGRRLVVLYFADCDPSGYQMGISVARKLQALKVLLGGFSFQVYRVALVPDQVREYGLPSTPLKSTEKRAGRWTAAMGVEQTEIDALAALRPELLAEIARGACARFWDATLAARVERYEQEWLERAWDMIRPTLDANRMSEIRDEARQQLDRIREQVEQINDMMRIDVDPDDLPPIEIPQAEVNPEGGLPPLIDSDWDFAVQCRALVASKRYEDGEAP